MDFENIYPPSIDINTVFNKARFFILDHWVDIGDIEIIPEGRYVVSLKLPDIETFVENLEYTNDGSIDWYLWGPRVN